MTVLWAHVDSNGWVMRWGLSVGDDVFLQTLPAGWSAVGCPSDVHGYTLSGQRWRLVGETWSLQNIPTD
jgi:hypothetical protein